MTDLSQTITPKSDQLNADDLIAGPRTITITKVAGRPNSPEQPIAISFEGDAGKPYLPCKSMRRVLVHLWGNNGEAFVGRCMTLYRDPSVQFGGLAVGGIRISHMSDIDEPVTMALTATRQSRKPYTVRPLVAEQRKQSKADMMIAAFEACTDAASVMSTIDRAREGLDIMRQRAPADFERVDRARIAAFNRHCKPEESAA